MGGIDLRSIDKNYLFQPSPLTRKACTDQTERCTCDDVKGHQGFSGRRGGRGGNAGTPGTVTVFVT